MSVTLTGIPMHKIKALMCFPFRLDFQTGQTFTEMAQTVQINHRSSREGGLRYSGSDEYGSHSPGPLKSTLQGVRKLCAPSGIPQPHHKASGKASRSYKSTGPFPLQLGGSVPHHQLKQIRMLARNPRPPTQPSWVSLPHLASLPARGCHHPPRHLRSRTRVLLPRIPHM